MALPEHVEPSSRAASTAITVADAGNESDVGNYEITPDKQDRSIGIVEVARLLNVSEDTVLRRAKELGARRGPRGKYLFSVERVREVVHVELLKGGVVRRNAPAASTDQRDGERDAAVVAQLEAGRTISEIVVATRTKLETVIHLRRLWLESKHAEREGIQHTCQGCRAPSNPVHSFCSTCGPKARVVGDDQQVVPREVKSTG